MIRGTCNQCSVDRHWGCFWSSSVIKLPWDGFLKSCESDFLRMGCQGREERRALPWASCLPLSLSLLSWEWQAPQCLVGRAWESMRSYLWSLRNNSQLAGVLKLTAMEGSELWFLRVVSAWILKRPVAPDSPTCSGNIWPLPLSGWTAWNAWLPLHC